MFDDYEVVRVVAFGKSEAELGTFVSHVQTTLGLVNEGHGGEFYVQD